jgi:hypothetical protein
MKDIFDEIRRKNMATIPDGQRQRGREEKDIFCYGGFKGVEDGVQWTADGVQLFVAKIVMGNGVDEEQKNEQAQNPTLDRPALVHKATS